MLGEKGSAFYWGGGAVCSHGKDSAQARNQELRFPCPSPPINYVT